MSAESVAGCIGITEAADGEQPRNQLDVVPEEGPSTSSCSRAVQVKRNLSDRSEGVASSSTSDSSGSIGSGNDGCNSRSSSKTLQSKQRKSVKRLAKIGKFLCFK